MHKCTTVAAAFALLASVPTVSADSGIGYPDGYRHWSHVKTLTLHEGHPLENPFKGIHHVYANPQGLRGLQAGQYSDGSVLVFDLLESVTGDHASAEGERVLVGVMVKDREKYSATGGWGFEGWAGGDPSQRLVEDGGRSCFDCHTSQAENSYVFSRWRD